MVLLRGAVLNRPALIASTLRCVERLWKTSRFISSFGPFMSSSSLRKLAAHLPQLPKNAEETMLLLLLLLRTVERGCC